MGQKRKAEEVGVDANDDHGGGDCVLDDDGRFAGPDCSPVLLQFRPGRPCRVHEQCEIAEKNYYAAVERGLELQPMDRMEGGPNTFQAVFEQQTALKMAMLDLRILYLH